MTDKRGHYTYRMVLKETKERLDDALHTDDIRFYKKILQLIEAANNPKIKRDATMKSLNSILDRASRDIEKLKNGL